MKTSETILKIYEAFTLAQNEFEGAVKDSINSHFKSRYADMEAIVEGIKPAFKKYNLGFIQSVTGDGPNTILTTRIIHNSGEWIETYYPLTCKDWTNPQAVGSAMTYARRYGLQAATGLPSVDDDGHAATDKPAIQTQARASQSMASQQQVSAPSPKPNLAPPKEVQERLKAQAPAQKSFAQKYKAPADAPPAFDANEPWPDHP